MTPNTTSIPPQSDVDFFLREFFDQYKEGSFYLTDLTIQVIAFFGITSDDAAVQCEHAHKLTSEETTRIEQFTHWGCQHLLFDHTIKRTGPNEYQHHLGHKSVYHSARIKVPVFAPKPVNLFDEALAFMKHARKLEFTLGAAKEMVADKWDAEILEKAGQAAFA